MITNHQQQQQQHEYDRGLRRRFTSTLVCWLGLEILNKLCDQSSVHLPCEEILTSTLVCWLGLDRPLSTEHPERPLHFYSFYTTPSQTPEVGKLAPHGDHLGTTSIPAIQHHFKRQRWENSHASIQLQTQLKGPKNRDHIRIL